MLLVLAAAIAAFAVLPSGAGALAMNSSSFTVSNPQAASHPDVTFAFTRNGTQSEDISSVDLELPPGMFANPEATMKQDKNWLGQNVGAPYPYKCAVATFNQDGCADETQVGTLSVDITAATILPLTIPGAIYVLNPNSNDAATLGLVLRPDRICIAFIFCAVPQKVYLQTNIKLNTFDTTTGLRTFTPGAPTTTTVAIPPIVSASNGIKLDITIEKMSLTFQSKAAKAKNGKYFMVASTSCTPSVSKISIKSVYNDVVTKTPSYSPTGCASVPFTPSVAITHGNTNSGQTSPVSFTLSTPQADAAIQQAHPKTVDIDFPTNSGIELSNLGGVAGCTEAQIRVDGCPANTRIGTASAVAPYLPPNFTGSVYAMSPITSNVPTGIVLRGPRGSIVVFRGTMGIRGDVENNAGRVFARFDAVPQLPYASVTVNLANPNAPTDPTKQLYKNPARPAYNCPLQTTTRNVTGYNGTGAVTSSANGTLVTSTSTYQLTNCDPEPVTTVVSGPVKAPNLTTDNTPNFTFSSSTGGSTFQCSWDVTTDYHSCGATYESPALPDGEHTLYVKAINGAAEDRTPESYPINIQTGGGITIDPYISSSTTVAAAHPDVTLGLNIAGGQPKTAKIRLANGFAPSLNARPVLCEKANAEAGTCPAGSAVGTASLTANIGAGSQTGIGTIYVTKPLSTSDDIGGVAIKIPFAGLGDYVATAGAYIVENGKALTIDIRNIPNKIGGTTDMTATNLEFQLDGDTGNFLTNASSCVASKFSADGTAWNGSIADLSSVPYASTGCTATFPPFNPTVNQVFNGSTNPLPASTPAGDSLASVEATVLIPEGNATLRSMRVIEPAVLGPNFNSFGGTADKCSSDAAVSVGVNVYEFNKTTCPTQAKVGTMVITSPLLPYTINGDVYLIEHSTLPWFGVSFSGQAGININIVGQTGLPDEAGCIPEDQPTGVCPQTITVNFTGLPDIPFNKVVFSLNAPDRTGAGGALIQGKILKVADRNATQCKASVNAASSILPNSTTLNTGVNSGVKNATQPIAISGCTNP
jgi:hypothetical protein